MDQHASEERKNFIWKRIEIIESCKVQSPLHLDRRIFIDQNALRAGASSARRALLRALGWGSRLALKDKPTKPNQETETETETEMETGARTKAERHSERDRDTDTQAQEQRQRDTKRDTQTQTQRDTHRHRQTQTHRHRQTDTQRHTHISS